MLIGYTSNSLSGSQSPWWSGSSSTLHPISQHSPHPAFAHHASVVRTQWPPFLFLGPSRLSPTSGMFSWYSLKGWLTLSLQLSMQMYVFKKELSDHPVQYGLTETFSLITLFLSCDLWWVIIIYLWRFCTSSLLEHNLHEAEILWGFFTTVWQSCI